MGAERRAANAVRRAMRRAAGPTGSPGEGRIAHADATSYAIYGLSLYGTGLYGDAEGEAAPTPVENRYGSCYYGHAKYGV